jgi:hypothetical protein
MGVEGDVEAVGTDKMVEVYVKIRDRRNELKKQFEEQDAELESKLKTIASELAEICKTNGADSIKTQYGTVIRSIKSRYWTNDWDSMYTFIAENDVFALLEKRLHQSNMKQFLEENPDVKPAGLNIDNEYTITVRRK